MENTWKYCSTATGKCNQSEAATETIPHCTLTKLNFVALVHKRTIPTELPPLVGDVSANFCG
jgi:hypothetical protein